MKNDFNKAKLKESIIEAIAKTKKQIAEYKELTRPVEPENAIGRISRMDAINNKSVTEAALRKAQSKLEGLNFALANINNDDFGICIKCKGQIPAGRILYMPQARTCVKCSR